jgi:hypothetical protein
MGVFIRFSKLFLTTRNEKTITTRIHVRDDDVNKTIKEITGKREIERTNGLEPPPKWGVCLHKIDQGILDNARMHKYTQTSIMTDKV